MPKQLTTDEWVQRAKIVHGSKYDYSNAVYVNRNMKLKIICPEHGQFEMVPLNHTGSQQQGCKTCGLARAAAVRTMTRETFIERAMSVHGNLYDYSNVVYKTSQDTVTIICPVHGEFNQLAGHHLNGHGCSTCAWSKPSIPKLTTAQWIEKAVKVHGSKYDYSQVVYTGNPNKVKIICKTHGVFEQSANDHISKGCGCRACTTTMPLTNKTFIEKANIIHSNKYSYDNLVYVNSSSRVIITCPKHGDFIQMANDHLSCKAGCPSCSCNGVSKPENELLAFIRSLGFNPTTRDRTIIKPFELDIVLEEQRIAFEFNGLYYHSDAFDSDVNKHAKKTILAEKAGYRLIHVYEDDWRDNRVVVEKTIKHILGISDKRLFARKLSVVNKDFKAVKDFLNINHMQGSGKGNAYCLQDGEDLVAVMQFSLVVSERGDTVEGRYELVRYATSCSVIGGASRLFAAFLKDTPEAKVIVSYSNNDMFTGDMYLQLGFNKIADVRPDYKVIVNAKRYHKANFKKTKLAIKYPEVYSDELTEKQICHKLKFYRIYNSGMKKWEYSVD